MTWGLEDAERRRLPWSGQWRSWLAEGVRPSLRELPPLPQLPEPEGMARSFCPTIIRVEDYNYAELPPKGTRPLEYCADCTQDLHLIGNPTIAEEMLSDCRLVSFRCPACDFLDRAGLLACATEGCDIVRRQVFPTRWQFGKTWLLLVGWWIAIMVGVLYWLGWQAAFPVLAAFVPFYYSLRNDSDKRDWLRTECAWGATKYISIGVFCLWLIFWAIRP